MAVLNVYLLVPYLLGVGFLFFLKYIFSNRRYYAQAFKIPGPHPLTIPIIGDLVTFIRNKLEIPQTFLRLSEDYGDIYRIWLPECTVMLSSPRYVELVLNDPELMDKSYHYDALAEILGPNSLIAVDGKGHKERLRIFRQAFNAPGLYELYVRSFNQSAEKVVQLFRMKAGTGWFSAGEILLSSATATIFDVALDADIKEFPACDAAVQKLDDLAEISMLRGCAPLAKNDFIFNVCLSGWKMWESLKKISLAVSKICSEKKQKRLSKDDGDSPRKYIHNLLMDQNSIFLNSVEGDITTTLFAALHTLTSLVGYSLLLLGLHPEVQEKVFEEDCLVQLELNGKDLKEADLLKYDLLQRVVKEVLRMYPPIPAVFRKVKNETKIDKYTVPKGSSIGLSFLSLHRNPSVYSNPKRFDPDRFLPENVDKRSKYAYAPFSRNRRHCPGARYGTNNAIVMIANIVRAFKIRTKYENVSEMDRYMKTCIALKDSNEYTISLELR